MRQLRPSFGGESKCLSYLHLHNQDHQILNVGNCSILIYGVINHIIPDALRYIFFYNRGSPNIEMDEQTFLVNRERAVDYLNSLDKVTYLNKH